MGFIEQSPLQKEENIFVIIMYLIYHKIPIPFKVHYIVQRDNTGVKGHAYYANDLSLVPVTLSTALMTWPINCTAGPSNTIFLDPCTELQGHLARNIQEVPS